MLRLDPDDPGALGKAEELLRSGAVVAIPTDTVYGLAVDPLVAGSVARIFALKERPADVPLPVLVANWEQVELVAGRLEAAAADLARRFWPGPLTLVVPRRTTFVVDLGGGLGSSLTVGIRWPDHPLVLSLCLRVGPMAVTSANRHGRPPASTADEVLDCFATASQPSAVLDGRECAGPPSTVVECRGPASRCLREGRIPWDDLRTDPGPRPEVDGGVSDEGEWPSDEPHGSSSFGRN